MNSSARKGATKGFATATMCVALVVMVACVVTTTWPGLAVVALLGGFLLSRWEPT